MRGRGPRLRLALGTADEERTTREVDLGVECVEVRRRHERAPRKTQGGLDEASDARRRVCVPDVALDRADGTVAHELRGGGGRIGLRECAQLDAIAYERTGRVALDVRHLVGGNTGHLERRHHRGRLPRDAGRRVARLARAVVRHAAAADDGEYVVVVSNGLVQPLEDHRANRVAEHGAMCLRVKRAHLAIDGADEPLLKKVAFSREGERGAAGDGHVRLA